MDIKPPYPHDMKPPYPHDMINDITLCPEVMTAMEDDDFAQHLYASICNRMWFKITPDQQGVFDRLSASSDRDKMEYNEYWAASWRSAGGIVADMREPFLRRASKRLEGYLDWYCSGSEGHLFEDVEELLKKLHWYSFGENDN